MPKNIYGVWAGLRKLFIGGMVVPGMLLCALGGWPGPVAAAAAPAATEAGKTAAEGKTGFGKTADAAVGSGAAVRAEVGAAPIRLRINGAAVEPDVPPVIVSGRTLVPARIIAENLGARVDWEARTRRVTVSHGTKTVVLTIGSARASISGKPARLDVPARIINGRTMVPLRFIGEALGAEVGWDAALRLVTVERVFRLTGMRFEQGDGMARLLLTADGPVSYRVAENGRLAVAGGQAAGVTLLSSGVSERPRIILDLPNTRVGEGHEPLVVGQGGVRLVRAETLEGPPPTARVVVDLARPVTWEVNKGDSPNEVILLIRYQLREVAYREGEGLLLRLTGPVEPAVQTETDPDRLVIDLPGLTADAELPPLLRPGGVVREVQVGPLPDDAAGLRLVVLLSGPAGYRVEPHPEGLLVRLLPRIVSVQWEERGTKVILRVRSSLPVPFGVQRGRQADTLEVRAPGAVPALPDGGMPAPSGRIEAAEARVTDDPPGVALVFTVKNMAGFRVAEGTPAGLLEIEITAGPLSGRRIVVDPGHGGVDPGAIGPGGTLEKDVVLAIALRLKDLLEAAGAQVLLTRADDRFVGLYDRAGLADDAGGEVFVSIHSNSSERRTVQGTETYHHRSAEAGGRLAEALQRRVSAMLGRPDRGVRQADYVVVREPHMPAALVEVAYLSNAEEEQLLRSSDFQERAALAIQQGIADFLQTEEAAGR